MEFDINDLASIGSVRDVPSYQLPPEAFTTLLNIRCIDGGLGTLLGWTSTLGTASVPPHFGLSVTTPSTRFWVYVSLAKAYGYDGTTHTNITRQSAGVDVDYTANDTPNWNGTVLGGIPILNNGIDVPQFWAPITLATKLQNLTNWPSTLRAKVVRSFGPFLFALNVTKSGTTHPHMAKWSHPAEPGTVPSSWDETSPTHDAGENELSDVNSGLLLDGLPLGDNMYLYKEQSTWKVRYIGGRQIFDFGQAPWLSTSGLLAPRCVCVTGDGLRQVVVTQDDIIWHNGNTVGSILEKKQRRRLFNEMDSGNYAQSFIFDNPLYDEVWFCYPGSGSSYPNKALLLNYSDPQRWAVTEADGVTFRWGTVGNIEAPTEEDWEATEETWEDDTGPWSELLRRRVILFDPAATKFYAMDVGTTRNGVEFLKTLQRTGLGLAGKKRDGTPIVDFGIRKLLTRILPKLTGSSASIRFGVQEKVDGAISWGASQTFNPAIQTWANPEPKSGMAVGFEVSTMGQWRMDGYKIDLRLLGKL